MLLGLLIRFVYSEFRHFYHPLILYLIVWGVGVALSQLGFVEYTPITLHGWTAIALSLFAFACGALTSSWIFGGRHKPVALQIDSQLLVRLLAVLTLLGGLGVILQSMFLEESFGLDLYLTNPLLARRLHTHIPIWGYLDLLNVMNVGLVVLYWRNKRRLKWWMLITLLICLSSSLLTTDRTRLFMMVIWAELAYGASRTTGFFDLRRFWRIGLVAIVLLVFFSLIGRHYKRSYVERFPQYVHFASSMTAIVDPFIYYTSAFPALGQLTQSPSKMYMGKASFAPLVHVASLAIEVEQIPLQGEFTFVPMEVNTYTYLRQFYADFGWFGVLLGPYLCAFLVCYFDAMRRRHMSLGWILLATLGSYCCLLSTFENLFIQEAIWFFALICLLLAGYERVRRSTSDRAGKNDSLSAEDSGQHYN